MERSDFVFSGKVIEIKDSNANATVQSSADLLEVNFEVSTTWKGVDETEVRIFTERDSASCGFNFNIDDEYLVYGNENNGEKMVNLCSKTTLLANASEDLTALGEGQQPSKEVKLEGKASTDSESSMDGPILIFSAAVFFIIIASYMYVKKNTR